VARKSKKQIELENIKANKNHRIIWIIISIATAVMMFFTFSQMGPVGSFLNNLFTIIFGTLYLVPLISICIYGLYVGFTANKQTYSISMLSGLIVLNVLVSMIGCLVGNEVTSFKQFLDVTVQDALNIFDVSHFVNCTGGIIGNFFYVAFYTLFTGLGALIVMIALGIISIILLVPSEFVKNIFVSMNSNRQKRKAEIKQRKEIVLQEKLRKEEILRKQKEEEVLKLAEEMNNAYDEAPVEETKEVVTTKTKPNDNILSTKSKYFINLNDEEINAKKESAPLNNEDIASSVSSATPKVVKQRSNGAYRLPKPYEKFLETTSSKSSNVNKTSSQVKGVKVIDILKNFDIEATLINTYIGPSVTKFEIKPDSSVKVNKILNISDNIKMELAAKDIRIEAPIPGRSAVGIEIPNVEPIPVRMLELMKAIPTDKKDTELLFALGKDLMGKGVYCDLVKMPHLLIAGATGSGKSVCINSIITSILLRTNPDDVKLVLVDPKRVEFTPYHDIPHLLWPVITDAQMAANMLKKIVVIMQERYEAFAAVGVRNIEGFNEYVYRHNANLTEGESIMSKLPYMVIIIDELADLMAIARKDVELSIQRITQLARASGIHLIVATQRPSTDVVTGLIKSNIPSRISFAVASSIDSRTILDSTGAERLLGNGDMLYYPQGENAPIRLQGVFVKDSEITNITEYVKAQAKPEYEDSYFEFLTNMNGTTVADAHDADTNDSLYNEVVEFVTMKQAASTSLLQRRFGIGYNRAARLIDTLEDRGIIGPSQGSKPREVYRKPEE